MDTRNVRGHQRARRLSVPGRDIVVPDRRSSVPISATVPYPAPTPTGPLVDSLVYRAGSQGATEPTKPKAHRVSQRTAHRMGSLARRSGSLSAAQPAKTSAETSRPKKHTRRRAPSFRRVISAWPVRLAAVLVLVGGIGFIGFDVWQTNTALKQDLSKTVTALGSPSAGAHQENEGRDETPVESSSIDSYKVASSLPRVITITDAKVRARVLSMDVNPDNSIQAPINIFDAGWYTGSAKPGEPGAALIDAHASGATRQGLFAYLDTLEVNDTVEVERGDGVTFIYEVAYTEIVEKDTLDMAKLLKTYGDAPQGLNLITCTGTYVKEQSTYDHRVVVYTKLVGQEMR